MHLAPQLSCAVAATPSDIACVQLFEVINEDYNDFVSLSTKLVDVDAAVDQFQAPLLDVQVQLELLFIPRHMSAH